MKIDTNRVSKSYIATYDLESNDDQRSIDVVRRTVKTLNKWLKESGLDIQYYVHVRGRGYRCNNRKFNHDLPLKFAKTADVYVKQRNPLDM